MSGYIGGIIGTALLVSLASYLSYGRENRGMISFALSLILAVAVAGPLVSWISAIPGWVEEGIPSWDGEGETVSGENCEQTAQAAYAAGVRSTVAARFSLEEENVRVLVEDFDFSRMRAGRVRVILSGRAVTADSRGIRQYVTEAGLGECEVEIEIG